MSTEFQVFTKSKNPLTPACIRGAMSAIGWESIIYSDPDDLVRANPESTDWENIMLFAWQPGKFNTEDIIDISVLYDADVVGSVNLSRDNQEWDVEYDGLDELEGEWIEKILKSKTTYNLNAASASDVDNDVFLALWDSMGKECKGLLAQEMEDFDGKYWL